MTDANVHRYLLDTNTVSYLLRGDNHVRNKVVSIPMSALSISAITKGELLYGLAKNPSTKLKLVIDEFLIRVDVLPWDADVAACYGALRAHMQKSGKAMGNLDLLIAAHALSLNVILVTNDKAFSQIDNLNIENWAQ